MRHVYIYTCINLTSTPVWANTFLVICISQHLLQCRALIVFSYMHTVPCLTALHSVSVVVGFTLYNKRRMSKTSCIQSITRLTSTTTTPTIPTPPTTPFLTIIPKFPCPLWLHNASLSGHILKETYTAKSF